MIKFKEKRKMPKNKKIINEELRELIEDHKDSKYWKKPIHSRKKRGEGFYKNQEEKFDKQIARKIYILKYLKGIIPKEWNNEKIRKIKKEFYEERLNRLFKRNREGKLLQILKKDEIEAIMFMTHSHPMGGHFGIDATYEKIKNRYYWKEMYGDIKNYIKYCDNCQRRGKKGGTGSLNPIEVTGPFEMIGIDFVGPLPRT